MKKIAITLFLLASLPATAQLWSGILSPTFGGGACTFTPAGTYAACAIDWTHAGVGGIPTTYTQSGATITSTGANQATQIQTALNACGTNHFVLLASGTFLINSNLTVPSTCILRGAGANLTILDAHGGGGYVVTLGSSSANPAASGAVNITAGATAGSTSITVSSTTGISTGKHVVINELNWYPLVGLNGGPGGGTCAPGGADCNTVFGQTRGNGEVRARGQTVEVTNVVGNVVTISPALYTDYLHTLPAWSPATKYGYEAYINNGTHYYVQTSAVSHNNSPYTCTSGGSTPAFSTSGGTVTDGNCAWLDVGVGTTTLPTMVPWSGTITDHAGVENLQVKANNTGTDADFGSNQCAYCWIKGVEANYMDGDAVDIYWGFKNEIRDSYFSNAYLHTPGTHDDAITLSYATSETLVENNIIERLHVATMVRAGVSGNVFGYNFTQGGYDTGAINFMIGSHDAHTAHTQFILVEGNVYNGIAEDSTWGSHSHGTYFRNWIQGTSLTCKPTTSGRNPVVCSPFGFPQQAGTNSWYPFQAARAESIDFPSPYFNSIGNVVGSAAAQAMTNTSNSPLSDTNIINCCGSSRSYDSVAYNYSFGFSGASDDGSFVNDVTTIQAKTLIHGDYSNITSAIQWQSPITHTLPPSFYLNAKPSWWGSLPYPAVGPDVTGGTGPGGHASLTASNPAMNCYFNVMGGVNGGAGSPLTFNANTCYSSVVAPSFTYSPQPVAFGSVAVGGSSTITVTISNVGTGPLHITGALTTGSALLTIVSDGCSSSTVGAGSTCTFGLRYAPTSASILTCSPVNQCVNVPDDAGNPDTINATGLGIGSAVLSPSSHLFANQVAGTVSPQFNFTVNNQQAVNLNVSSVTASGDYQVFSNTCVSGSPIAPAGTCNIIVTFTPTAIGSRFGTLTVNDDAPNTPQTAALSGNGTSQITLSPTSLTFSSQAIGSPSASQAITITNVGSTTITLTSIATSGDFSQSNTCAGTIAASATCTVNVVFTPIAAGIRTGVLSVTDSAAGSPQTAALTGSTAVPGISGAARVRGHGLITGGQGNPVTSGENAYCAPGTVPYDGTWIGPRFDPPPPAVGVAELPRTCNYTTLAATPTGSFSGTCPIGAGVVQHNFTATPNGQCYVGWSGDHIPAGDPRAGQTVDYFSVNDMMDSSIVAGVPQCGIWFKILPTSDNTPTGTLRSYPSGIGTDTVAASLPYGAICPDNAWNWITTANFAGLPGEGIRITPAWLGLASINGYPPYTQPAVAGRYVPKLINTGTTIPPLFISSQVSHWRLEGLEITNGTGQAFNSSLIARQSGAFGTAVVQRCQSLDNPVTGCPSVNSNQFTAVSNVIGTAFQNVTLPASVVIDNDQFPLQAIPGVGTTAIVNGAATPSTSATLSAAAILGTVGTNQRVRLSATGALPYNFISGATFHSQGITGGSGLNTDDTIECGPTDVSATCTPLALTSSQFTYLGASSATGPGTGGQAFATEEINGQSALNDHMVFNHLLLHGGDSPTWQNNAGVTHTAMGATGGTRISITNSYIGDIWCNVFQPYAQCVEGQGIGGFSSQFSSQTIKIYNNFVAASTEGVLFGGSNWDAPTIDVEERRNHWFKPLTWYKYCLPGNSPAYCNGLVTPPVADPTRTLTVTGVSVAAGVVTVTASANFPTGWNGNVPLDLEGITGSGVVNINGGALTDTVATNTLTFSARAGATCGTGCVTTGATIRELLAPDVKNGVEYKNGLRVLIEGDVMGPQCTWQGQSDQFGECLHLNLLQGRYGALPGDTMSMVTVRYNLISGANKGIIITEEEAGNVGPAGGNAPTLNPATGPFSIHDNVVDDINPTKWGLGSNGTVQAGAVAISIGNPFAGPYVPQTLDFNHNTFIQSTAQGATPISTRAQLLSTTDFSGRLPLCTGTATTSINPDGTGTVTIVSIPAPTPSSACPTFTPSGGGTVTAASPDPLGYYMNIPTGSGTWVQLLSWTSPTTFRVSPNGGTNASPVNFTLQCSSGCQSFETAPITPWPNITLRNNIAVGGMFNGLQGGTQTTVATLNGLMDLSSSAGWCFVDNILPTGAASSQSTTWPYPQQATASPNLTCPTTAIASTGCTAKVGASSSPCLNPDSTDAGNTMGGVGFSSYTDGNLSNLLTYPSGTGITTNNYVLLPGTPGSLAGSDGKDIGADIGQVSSHISGVQ